MSFFKSVVGRLVVAGIGIVVVAVGVFAFSKAENAINGKEVGDCVSASGSSSNVDLEDEDCSASAATYVVTSTDGDCDDTEISYEETVNGGTTEELCLAYNVEQGDCIEFSSSGTTPDKKVDCSVGGPTVVEAVKVEDGADGTCPNGVPEALVYANTKRDTLICFQPVG